MSPDRKAGQARARRQYLSVLACWTPTHHKGWDGDGLLEEFPRLQHEAMEKVQER
jgi:hypothetical protein